MKYSRQREAILNVVQTAHHHPTADWIYDEVRKIHPAISLATVYRNLKQLVASRQLAMVVDGPAVRYDRNLDDHGHFKCETCGKLLDLYVPKERLMESINIDPGLEISNLELTLTGSCYDCH